MSAFPNSSNGTAGAIASRAASTAHSVVDKAAEAAIDLASSAHSQVDRMTSAANSAAESLQRKGEKLSNASAKMLAPIGDYIKEKPMRSLGIALAVGYLLSRLSR